MAQPSVIIEGELQIVNLSKAEREILAFARGAEKTIRGAKLSFDDRQITSSFGRITGKSGEFAKSLDAATARVLAFGAAAGSVYLVEKAFVEMTRATINVEKSLKDINVILGLNSKELSRFGDELFKIAKDTGQTFKVVGGAATELSRQGLNSVETLKRLKDAMVLSQLSGLDAKDSVSALTATINSFNKTVLDSTRLVNQFAAVDSAFAVSSGDLAEAIKRVGSTAQDAGVSIEQLIGLVTSAVQTTGRSADVIGNSFKTIFTRIQDEKTLDFLERFNVAVRDTQGQLLPTIDILRNLASVYDNLGQVQQNQIAKTVAGVYQSNIFRAQLSDLSKQFSVYESALNTATKATDQAISRSQELNETLGAKLNRTIQNLTQVGAGFGERFLGNSFRSILDSINSTIEVNQEDGGKTVGAAFAKGIVSGLGEFFSITRPGGLAVVIGLGSILKRITSDSVDSFRSMVGLNSQKDKLANAERLIATELAKQTQLVGLINSGSSQTLMIRERILKSLQDEMALSRAASRLAPGLVKISDTAKVRLPSSRAVGHIPEAMEKMGAYNGGYTPGAVKEMSIPKLGNVIYNTAEKVKYFPGLSQPAIIPPQGSKAGINYNKSFIQQHGFSPYRNEGLIPNFANIITGAGYPQSTTFKRLIEQAKKGEYFNKFYQDYRKELPLVREDKTLFNKIYASQSYGADDRVVLNASVDLFKNIKLGNSNFLSILKKYRGLGLFEGREKALVNFLSGKETDKTFQYFKALQGDDNALAIDRNVIGTAIGRSTKPGEKISNSFRKRLGGELSMVSEMLGFDAPINAQAAVFAGRSKFKPNFDTFRKAFASFNDGLIPAVNRESKFVPKSLIRVGQSSVLKSPVNPSGLGVYNLRDEPQGLNQGIQRAFSEGFNPKTYGVPNFAEINIPQSFPRQKGDTRTATRPATEQEESQIEFALKLTLAEIKEGNSNLKSINEITKILKTNLNLSSESAKEFKQKLDAAQRGFSSEGAVAARKTSEVYRKNKERENLSERFVAGVTSKAILDKSLEYEQKQIIETSSKKEIALKRLENIKRIRVSKEKETRDLLSRGKLPASPLDIGIESEIEDRRERARAANKVKEQRNAEIEQRFAAGFASKAARDAELDIIQNQIIEKNQEKEKKSIADARTKRLKAREIRFQKLEDEAAGIFGGGRARDILAGRAGNRDILLKARERRNDRIQNIGLNTSIGAPIVAGIANEFAPQGNDVNSRVGRSLVSGIGTVGSFAGVGASFGAPGIIAGAAIGGAITIGNVMKEFADKLPAVQDALELAVESQSKLQVKAQEYQKLTNRLADIESGRVQYTESEKQSVLRERNRAVADLAVKSGRRDEFVRAFQSGDLQTVNKLIVQTMEVSEIESSAAKSLLRLTEERGKIGFGILPSSESEISKLGAASGEFLSKTLSLKNKSTQKSLADFLKDNPEELSSFRNLLNDVVGGNIKEKGGIDPTAIAKRRLSFIAKRAGVDLDESQLEGLVGDTKKIEELKRNRNLGKGSLLEQNRLEPLERQFFEFFGVLDSLKKSIEAEKKLGGEGNTDFTGENTRILFNYEQDVANRFSRKDLELESRFGAASRGIRAKSFGLEKESLRDISDIESFTAEKGNELSLLQKRSLEEGLIIARQEIEINRIAESNNLKELEIEKGKQTSLSKLRETLEKGGFERLSEFGQKGEKGFANFVKEDISSLLGSVDVFSKEKPSDIIESFDYSRQDRGGVGFSPTQKTELEKIVADYQRQAIEIESKSQEATTEQKADFENQKRKLVENFQTQLKLKSAAEKGEDSSRIFGFNQLSGSLKFQSGLRSNLSGQELDLFRKERGYVSGFDRVGDLRFGAGIEQDSLRLQTLRGLGSGFGSVQLRQNQEFQGFDARKNALGDAINSGDFNRISKNIDEFLKAIEDSDAKSQFGDLKSSLEAMKEPLESFKNGIEKSNIELRARILERTNTRIAAEKAFSQGRATGDELRASIGAENTDKIKGGSYGLGDLTKTFSSSFAYNSTDFFNEIEEGARNSSEVIKSSFKGAFDEFRKGTLSGKEAFRSFAISILESLQSKILDIGLNQVLGATVGRGLESLSSAIPKRANGGFIKGYSSGGLVTGGSGFKDDVFSTLSSGDFVVKKSAVQKYGIGSLERLNSIGGNVALANSYEYATSRPTNSADGILNIDPNLSNYALTDENNPQNRIRMEREGNLSSYLNERSSYYENYQSKLRAFRTQRRRGLTAAYVSAAISAVGVGAQAYGGGSKPNVPSSKTAGSLNYGNLDYNPNNISLKYGFANGGIIQRYAMGGSPSGSDNIPVLLTGGEYVINNKTASKLGTGFLNRLNNGQLPGFNNGGLVGIGGYQGTTEGGTEFVSKLDEINKSILLLVGNKGQGANVGTGNNVYVSTTVNISPSGKVESSESKTESDKKEGSFNAENGKKFNELIKGKVLETIHQEMRPGGLLYSK